MPFNPESARKAGSKSKRGPIKPPPVKTKMVQLFEDLIADLLKNKDKLSIQQKIRIVQLLSNYIVPKTKSVVDDETLDKDKINQITIVYDSQEGNKPILD
jgi:hypothetical protein